MGDIVSEYVNVKRVGTTAIVTLTRPDRGNTLSGDGFNDLRKAALKLSDAPPGAIIITGSGNTFNGGLDLSADNPVVARIESLARAKDVYALSEFTKRLRTSIDLIGRVK